MLAEAAEELPLGEGWVYEPKWDGFRALVFKDGEAIHLGSRSGQPLQRYFPEVVEALRAILPDRCVLDGELILPGPRGLDFDALQARLHPAASRVAKLAKETPAGFTGFDLLALGDEDWRPRRTDERRSALLQVLPAGAACFPTPRTAAPEEARRWFEEFEGAGCDGLIARRVELPYLPGKRVMVKLKHHRTADVVVGGYREGKTPGTVGALLLGVYDEAGMLHHLGHTSSFSASQKRALFEQLQPLRTQASFEGRIPDAPSRWSSGRETAPWTPVEPRLVCEVRYDALQGPRLRHASTFLRWRTDKPPARCTFEQLQPPRPFSLERILALARAQAMGGLACP
jgi:ATP-dependent DNA ligase